MAGDKVISIDEKKDKLLSIDDVLEADDIEYRTIPAWGGKMRIGSLTAEEFIEWQEAADGVAKRLAGLNLIWRSWVDEDNNRVGKPEHVHKFKKKAIKETNKVIAEIIELNGLGDDKAKEAKNG